MVSQTNEKALEDEIEYALTGKKMTKRPEHTYYTDSKINNAIYTEKKIYTLKDIIPIFHSTLSLSEFFD